MTVKEKQEQLCGAIKELYFRSGMGNLFCVDHETHNKIIGTLTQMMLEENPNDLFPIDNLKGHTRPRGSFELGLFVMNTLLFLAIFLKYTIVSIGCRAIFRQVNVKSELACGVRLVFINSAQRMDRLNSFTDSLSDGEKFKMYYVLTSSIRQVYDRSIRYAAVRFLPFPVPKKDAVLNGLSFLMKDGKDFTSFVFMLFKSAPLTMRIRVVKTISMYLFSLIIYYYWSKDRAKELSVMHPNSLFIFDQDNTGRDFMLADSLNKIDAKTLVIQHGILINPSLYIPTCKYMACSSQRGKKALMKSGVDKNRLFVIGQSFQTISDSLAQKKIEDSKYPFTIIAADGSIWGQKLSVSLLHGSKLLDKFNYIYIRPHPAHTERIKRIWAYSSQVLFTAKGESLGHCLKKSRVVITFSFDALIASIRQSRPTILCIPEEVFVPEWHKFLLEIPKMRLAKHSNELDEIINDKEFIESWKYPFSADDHKQIEFAFGSLNTHQNFKDFLAQVMSTWQVAPGHP